MIEEPIIITTGYLKRSRLFDGEDFSINITFINKSFRVRLSFDFSQVEFLCFGQYQASFRVRLEKVSLKFGHRAFFLDALGRQSPHVVFYQGKFYVGAEFLESETTLTWIEKRDLLKKARERQQVWVPVGASKRRISALAHEAYRKLKQEDFEQLPVETRRLFVQLQPTVTALGARKLSAWRREGSWFAIKHRSDVEPFLLASLKAISAAHYEFLSHKAAYPPRFPSRSASEAFEIKADGLERAGLLEDGELKAFYAGWDFNDDIIERILVVTDLRDVDRPRIMFEYSSNEEFDGRWQLAMLERAGNLRWYFRCPLTDKRCASLFIRDGYVGSQGALNLV
ncbi:MAG TPA: hypothetical protein VHN58_11605 [Croceicoccus sp.]|nr:hypothetical protein [Croceicoccus sp.]